MPADSSPTAITAQQAVNRGILTVNGPVFALMLGPGGLGFGIGALLHDNDVAWSLAIWGGALGWICAWLAWSILTPRWRAWAYERVDDLDELKRLAIAERLIWPDGHLFGKTEIAPRALRDRLKALETAKSRG